MLENKVCPACQGTLKINRMLCTVCGAEYPVSEELSGFQRLTVKERLFLETFLRCKGNLKAVGETLSMSYPTVKRRLDELLKNLGYYEEESEEPVVIDPELKGSLKLQSILPSEIIKRRMFENGGEITVPQLRGGNCVIRFADGGRAFVSNKVGSGKTVLQFSVFDRVVEFLKSCPDGRAMKGHGRNKDCKVGYGDCTEGTVLYVVATECFGRKNGESTLDPVFVLAAVLEWAGIAKNERNYISLTPEYRALSAQSQTGTVE